MRKLLKVLTRYELNQGEHESIDACVAIINILYPLWKKAYDAGDTETRDIFYKALNNFIK